MKRIQIILYVLFVGLITFFVAGYGQANKTFVFLSEFEEEALENINDLIVVTMIANTQNEYDIYVSPQPLIEVTIESEALNALFSIYSVLSYDTRDDYQFDYVMLVTQFIAQNRDQVTEDDANLTITLELEKMIPSLQINTIHEEMVKLYDETMYMMILNQDYFNEADEFNVVQRLSLQYETELANQTILSLEESVLSTLHPEFSQDKTFNITRCNEWYHHETYHAQFESLNWVQIRPLVYEALIVLPLTYALFLHQPIKHYRQTKKESK